MLTVSLFPMQPMARYIVLSLGSQVIHRDEAMQQMTLFRHQRDFSFRLRSYGDSSVSFISARRLRISFSVRVGGT